MPKTKYPGGRSQASKNLAAATRTNGQITTQEQRRAEHLANQRASMAKNAVDQRPRSVHRRHDARTTK